MECLSILQSLQKVLLEKVLPFASCMEIWLAREHMDVLKKFTSRVMSSLCLVRHSYSVLSKPINFWELIDV